MKVQLLKLSCHREWGRAAACFALLLSFFALAACGSEEPQATAMPPAVTAETGGMLLPSAAEPGTSPADTTAQAGGEGETGGAVEATAAGAAGTASEPALTSRPQLAVGDDVVTTATVYLYAEADPLAQRFGQYPAGSRLIVIEGEDVGADYPVTVDGQRWYRVRAMDGLVGWVPEP